MKDKCFKRSSIPKLLHKCIAKCLYDNKKYGWIVILTRVILCIQFYRYYLENKGQGQCGSKWLITCFILSLKRKSTPIHSISFTMEIRNCPNLDYLTLNIKGQGHKKGHEVMHYFFISYYQPLANIGTLNRKSLLNKALCLFNIW